MLFLFYNFTQPDQLVADNKSNSVSNYSRGITYSKHIPKKTSPFERVFEIFKDLLTHTSGNLDETFRWLDILDKEYNIFTDEYTLENFEEDLKKEVTLKIKLIFPMVHPVKEKNLTAKLESALRSFALNQIFGKLKKTGLGNHKINQVGQGGEKDGDLRQYQFGDELASVNMTESLKNAQINHGLTDFILTENDLVVDEVKHKAQMSTVLMIDISHSMILYGEDRITPAKKVAMALVELIKRKYPKDTIDIIVFGNDAWPIKIKDLPYLKVRSLSY